MSQLNVQRLRSGLRQSFYAFTAFLASMRGADNLFTERTFYPICKWYQDAYYNKLTRLACLDPRNHLKSTILRAFVLWVFFQTPDERFDSPEEMERALAFLAARPWIRGANSRIRWNALSKPNAMLQVEAIERYPAEERLYRTIIPEHCPEEFAYKGVKKVWNSEELIIPSRVISGPAEASLSASGVESQSTSLHFDIVIFDDPVTEATWRYPKEIEIANAWVELIPPLLEVADPSMPGASLSIVNGNNWTYFDTQTYIKDNHPEYVRWYRKAWTCAVCGRNNCIQSQQCAPTDEPLWPERWSRDGLIALKTANKQIFMAQYENDPVGGETVAFDVTKVRDCYYDEVANEVVLYKHGTLVPDQRIPLGALRCVLSMDPATSTDERSCRTAIGVYGEDRTTQAVYKLDQFAGHVAPDDGINAIIDLYVKWRSRGAQIAHVGFEAVAGQKFILPALVSQAKLRGVWQLAQAPSGEATDLIQMYKTDRNLVKEDRISNLLGWRINAGLLYVATNMPHRNLFFEELSRHPVSKSNDLLDETAYAESLYARQSMHREAALEERARLIRTYRQKAGVIF